MAIALNPKRNTAANHPSEAQVEQFISGAGKQPAEDDQNRRPIMIRIQPELLSRIDRAAKRRGISRTAFIVSSVAEKLEGME